MTALLIDVHCASRPCNIAWERTSFQLARERRLKSDILRALCCFQDFVGKMWWQMKYLKESPLHRFKWRGTPVCMLEYCG